MMRKISLIIFDLDGTLVDSRQDIVNAVNYTLKRIGLEEKGAAEIVSYIGDGVENLLKKSLGEDRRELFDRALSVFVEHYRHHAVDNTRPFPHVKETLEYFRDKRKAIVTNRRHEFAAITLKALGLDGYFANIVGGDDVGCMKPSSCPLDTAMRTFNIRNRNSAIIVGDMTLDVIAGKGAGIITCAVTYGLGKKEDILKAGPDYIIDDIAELKQIIC